MTNSFPLEHETVHRIMFSGTDQFGHKFTVLTVHRPKLHPGYATLIYHRAYGQGGRIMSSVCVTWPKARDMHSHWVETLTRGPLPDSIEDIGMGEWTVGVLVYPKARKYSEGG